MKTRNWKRSVRVYLIVVGVIMLIGALIIIGCKPTESVLTYNEYSAEVMYKADSILNSRGIEYSPSMWEGLKVRDQSGELKTQRFIIVQTDTTLLILSLFDGELIVREEKF